MLLPTITTKQKEILLLLYRFRFLNRIQIQSLLKHKNPKNTNVWLKDLTTKNYIGRIFEKTPGINKPAIYFISKNGIKFLKSNFPVNGVIRDLLPSFAYIKQENGQIEQYSCEIIKGAGHAIIEVCINEK